MEHNPPGLKAINELVRMDPFRYPDFTDDSYLQWITTSKTFNTLYGTLNVLHKPHVSNDIWEAPDFKEQQKFMWPIAVHTTTSKNGKMFIHQYPGDAQQYFHLLYQEYRGPLQEEYNTDDIKPQTTDKVFTKWHDTPDTFVQQLQYLIKPHGFLTPKKGEHSSIVPLTKGEKKTTTKQTIT